jgi:hypothetical protein
MKTAGTTLFEGLRRNYRPDEIYPDPEIDLRRDADTIAFRHQTIRYLQTLSEERLRRIRLVGGHFPYLARDVLGHDFRTLTVLRDPVDRTVSLLRQFRRPAPWAERGDIAPMSPLALEEIYEAPHVYEPLVHNHQTKLFSMTWADNPTGYMQVIDVDPARLALAKDNLARVDVVGLTEQLDDFLDLVTERFDWRLRRGARLNAAPSADDAVVSASFRRRIEQDNAIDVEFYEYAKALVEEQRRGRGGRG